jgi:hypothetical protein
MFVLIKALGSLAFLYSKSKKKSSFKKPKELELRYLA